jgi:hypothetical protein
MAGGYRTSVSEAKRGRPLDRGELRPTRGDGNDPASFDWALREMRAVELVTLVEGCGSAHRRGLTAKGANVVSTSGAMALFVPKSATQADHNRQVVRDE